MKATIEKILIARMKLVVDATALLHAAGAALASQQYAKKQQHEQ